MIKKVIRIRNIASYKDFTGTTINGFNRFNIIYGENGSGKTVLSKLVSLYSEMEDSEIKNDIYDNLFNNQSLVEFDINGSTMVLNKSDFPKEKIYVFNSLFVSNYLHDGSTSNTRRFNTNDGVVARIESPTIKRLKDRNSQLTKEIGSTNNDGLRKEIIELSVKINEVADSIRKDWNSQKILKGKNLVKPENNFAAKPREFSVIQSDIEKYLKELELLQRDDFAIDLETLKKLNKDMLSIDIKTIFNDVNTVIKNIAKQKVIEKIQKHIDSKTINNVQNWFESGLKLLVTQKNNSNLVCPLCESNLEAELENLIADYQGYFDESLKTLQNKLNQHLSLIKSEINLSSNRDEVTLNNLIAKYKGVVDGKLRELPQFEFGELKKYLDKIEFDIKEKLNDYKYSVDINIPKIEEIIEAYNKNISLFNSAKHIISDYILSRSSSNKVEVNLRSLFYEKFSYFIIKNTSLLDPINKLKDMENSKEEKEKEKVLNLRKIDEEILKLQVESEKINEYLLKLNISKFKVSIKDQLTVVYTEGTTKECLKHSLSEGEKTTLAFAYFLSKMSYEVGKENYKDYIVFMDDPISSIDEDRMFYTANMIYEEFSEIRQMFISSHSFKFLRIMNNFLKFYNRRRRLDQRELNIYKARDNNGSEIINLPEDISFFTTLYYSKLQLLIKYLSNEPLSEDDKKSIPNSVRIVLESFLSFKFGYLKGVKYGVTPGLKELFEAVKNEEDIIFENLVEVDGVNKDNWKDKLDYLFIRYTDMFSHGNPAAVVNDEPPSTDIELKKFCETTVSLIKFLDGIHFRVALVNCVQEVG